MSSYFAGYLVEGDAAGFYERITADLARRFSIRNLALKAPPHITLKPPFDTDDIAPFQTRMVELASGIAPPLSLRGFGSFRKGTIFLDVVGSPALEQALTQAVEGLASSGEAGRPLATPIHPHVSIARHLREDRFDAIWDYLQTLSPPSFDLAFDNLTLFTHDGAGWQVEASVPIPERGS